MNKNIQGIHALISFIRKKARLDIMKADEYGQGYYQAIKDMEEWSGVSILDEEIDKIQRFKDKFKKYHGL